MGKGSKQRPTSAAFYDNFDKIFGGGKAMTRYKCERCGILDDESEVHEIVEKNWEPMGDQYVARHMIHLECGRCGGEDVDEFNPAYCDTCDD
jgi:hypothetical protein|tara:strand:+ start:97 stop:372 length:276 start_codon:yes stop_codon:yes gene_type:complete